MPKQSKKGVRKEVLESLMWNLAIQIARLKEKQCENSGLNWFDNFGDELKNL